MKEYVYYMPEEDTLYIVGEKFGTDLSTLVLVNNYDVAIYVVIYIGEL